MIGENLGALSMRDVAVALVHERAAAGKSTCRIAPTPDCLSDLMMDTLVGLPHDVRQQWFEVVVDSVLQAEVDMPVELLRTAGFAGSAFLERYKQPEYLLLTAQKLMDAGDPETARNLLLGINCELSECDDYVKPWLVHTLWTLGEFDAAWAMANSSFENSAEHQAAAKMAIAIHMWDAGDEQGALDQLAAIRRAHSNSSGTPSLALAAQYFSPEGVRLGGDDLPLRRPVAFSPVILEDLVETNQHGSGFSPFTQLQWSPREAEHVRAFLPALNQMIKDVEQDYGGLDQVRVNVLPALAQAGLLEEVDRLYAIPWQEDRAPNVWSAILGALFDSGQVEPALERIQSAPSNIDATRIGWVVGSRTEVLASTEEGRAFVADFALSLSDPYERGSKLSGLIAAVAKHGEFDKSVALLADFDGPWLADPRPMIEGFQARGRGAEAEAFALKLLAQDTRWGQKIITGTAQLGFDMSFLKDVYALSAQWDQNDGQRDQSLARFAKVSALLGDFEFAEARLAEIKDDWEYEDAYWSIAIGRAKHGDIEGYLQKVATEVTSPEERVYALAEGYRRSGAAPLAAAALSESAHADVQTQVGAIYLLMLPQDAEL